MVSEVYDVHVQVSFDFFFYDSMLRSTPAARVPAAVILIDIFSRERIIFSFDMRALRLFCPLRNLQTFFGISGANAVVF